MGNFRPTEMLVISKRDPKHSYNPSSFLRTQNGVLEQMWWSTAGEAIWEPVLEGVSLAQLAVGNT